MKCAISIVLLLVALLGTLTGWVVERSHYANRLVEETEREGAISSTLSTALFTNMIYGQIDTLTETEFARKRRFQLIENVVYLFYHRDNAVDRTIIQSETYSFKKEQTTAILTRAGRSLELLSVADESEFAQRFVDAGFDDDFMKGLVNDDGKLEPLFSDFVNDCMNFHKHLRLSYEHNPTTKQTLVMAECAIKLYESGILDKNVLHRAQMDLEALVTGEDGRKLKLLKKISVLLGGGA